MKKFSRVSALQLVLALGAAVACSSNSDSNSDDTPNSGGTAGTAMGGESNSQTAGASGNDSNSGGTNSGGTSSGGDSSGGSGGSDTAVGGTGGSGSPTGGTGGDAAGGTATGGDGGAGDVPRTPAGFLDTSAAEGAAGPFTCTEYIGAYLSMEWYGASFESAVGDDKWELKWHHHGHVLEWGDPNSPFWANTGDPLNDASGAPISSACAMNQDAPDRVVFLALSWELADEASWMNALEMDISTIRLKYPGVKWIDIVPMVRCPSNMHCNANANYGPGADTDVGRQDCYVPPFEDSAMEKVVLAHAGDGVGLGPILEATMCNNNGAHLTGADNTLESQHYADYYKVLP